MVTFSTQNSSPSNSLEDATEMTDIKSKDESSSGHVSGVVMPEPFHFGGSPPSKVNNHSTRQGLSVNNTHLENLSTLKLKKGKASPILFYKMFRYADQLDISLMFTGIMIAVSQGAALPTALFVFAEILNAMIFHLPCWNDFVDRVTSGNYSGNITADLEHHHHRLPPHLISGQSLFSLVGPECGYYAIIGFGIFIAGIYHASAWSIAGERQIYRIRSKLFQSLLNKDASWFDDRSPEFLNSAIFE